MTEEDEEYSIDYRKIVTHLHEKGYEGYVATEYEENYWDLLGNPMVEKEQVAAHQKMIRDVLKDLQG